MSDPTNGPPLAVRVWGPMACFTRPEHKVERVSYPVPTPSAARGVLEAIFWRPEFSYRVRSIEVLNPVRYFSIFRNEVNSKASPGSNGISITDDRAQRNTLALQEVAYILRADIAVKPGVNEDPAKYRDQFRRRVAAGRCFHRPYLGCREFACDFEEAPVRVEREKTAASGVDGPLGLMLFDIAFGAKGNAPIFFEATAEQGVIPVPDVLYEQRTQLEAMLK